MRAKIQKTGRIEKSAGESTLSCLSRERLGKVDPESGFVNVRNASIEFTIDFGLEGMVYKKHAGRGQQISFGRRLHKPHLVGGSGLVPGTTKRMQA